MLALLILIFMSSTSFAQLEYSKWWWHANNQLDFSAGGAPVYGAGPGNMNPTLSAVPDCSSISDRYGNIQFGATTQYIYDRNGNSMPYGPINVSAFGIESVTIVPKPCNEDIYYVFMARFSGLGDPDGISYSTVDMTLNGGLGDIVSVDSLDTNTFKCIDATRHANGKDFWLTGIDLADGNTFKSWLISDTGIAATPVISSAGTALPTFNNTAGLAGLRFSPDASKLVLSCQLLTIPPVTPQRLYNFDNATGAVSFVCDLDDTGFPDQHLNTYACFSPNSSKVYITSVSSLWQFDLSSGVPATIASSGQVIFDTATANPFFSFQLVDLQIGMDSAIYLSRAVAPGSANYFNLGVIANPDSLGAACHFVHDSIATAQLTYNGLPNIIYDLYTKRKIVVSDPPCTGDTVQLSFDRTVYMDSVHWQIGDATTPYQFFVSDSVASVVIDSAGTYPIMAIAFSHCRSDTFYDSVTVILSPNPYLGADTVLCEGDTIAFANDWFYSYA